MSILIGIHYEPQKQFDRHLQRYEAILKYNGLESIRLCSSKPGFWDEVKQLNLFIYYWGQWDAARQNARAVIPVVERELNIPCFPNVRTCWAYDDKIREYYLMQSRSFPMARCWIFWEEKDALQWTQHAPLPVVFKLAGGAGSKNVILIRDKKSLVCIVKIMFQRGIQDSRIPGQCSLAPGLYLRLKRWAAIRKRRLLGQEVCHQHSCPNWVIQKNYVLFQEFLPGNSYDTRVTVIGDRAFAFRRMNRKDDFRSSGSGSIDYNTDSIDMSFVKEAMRISQEMEFQSMAYDCLYDPDGAVKFCETSYAFVDTAIHECPGYWDSNLEWHEGHFWPQYFQLMDALGLPDLKQPDGLI